MLQALMLLKIDLVVDERLTCLRTKFENIATSNCFVLVGILLCQRYSQFLTVVLGNVQILLQLSTFIAFEPTLAEPISLNI